MILNGIIQKEMNDLEDAYRRLADIKRLEIYSSETIIALERLEEEIRWREYGIAHMRAYALKNRPLHQDELPFQPKFG
jgi:hypothetical protein